MYTTDNASIVTSGVVDASLNTTTLLVTDARHVGSGTLGTIDNNIIRWLIHLAVTPPQ